MGSGCVLRKSPESDVTSRPDLSKIDLSTEKGIDQLVRVMMTEESVETPVEHTFTPGMYCRKIFVPKDTIVVTMIHRTRHPYVVLKGRVRVWIPGQRIQELTAGHMGITEPGTRRIVKVLEDCEWVTFHSTDLTDIDEIERTVVDRFSDEGDIELEELKELENDHDQLQKA